MFEVLTKLYAGQVLDEVKRKESFYTSSVVLEKSIKSIIPDEED